MGPALYWLLWGALGFTRAALVPTPLMDTGYHEFGSSVRKAPTSPRPCNIDSPMCIEVFHGADRKTRVAHREDGTGVPLEALCEPWCPIVDASGIPWYQAMATGRRNNAGPRIKDQTNQQKYNAKHNRDRDNRSTHHKKTTDKLASDSVLPP